MGVGVMIYMFVWKRREGEKMRDFFDDLLSYVPKEETIGRMKEEGKAEWVASADQTFCSVYSVTPLNERGSEEREREEEEADDGDEEFDGRGVENSVMNTNPAMNDLITMRDGEKTFRMNSDVQWPLSEEMINRSVSMRSGWE